MPRRRLILLFTFAAAFTAFFLHSLYDPNWSSGDVASLAAFACLSLLLTAVLLSSTSGTQDTSLLGSIWRTLKVGFASLAAAFATCLLLGVLALPLFGLQGFDYLLAPGRVWILLLLATAFVPFVRRHLR
jgi:uncharacterized membrane protein